MINSPDNLTTLCSTIFLKSIRYDKRNLMNFDIPPKIAQDLTVKIHKDIFHDLDERSIYKGGLYEQRAPKVTFTGTCLASCRCSVPDPEAFLPGPAALIEKNKVLSHKEYQSGHEYIRHTASHYRQINAVGAIYKYFLNQNINKKIKIEKCANAISIYNNSKDDIDSVNDTCDYIVKYLS